MTEHAITCKELVELVTDYLEDALPPPTRAWFDAHLTECEGCENYLEQMRQTIRLTGALREEEIEPEARAALLDAFRAWRRG